MSKFIIDSSPIARTRQTFQYDAGTDQYLLQDEQDVTGLLEANKADRNSGLADGRHPDKGLGRKIASIPLLLWQELYTKGITRDKKAFARWLNDPDNRYFRTDGSHI